MLSRSRAGWIVGLSALLPILTVADELQGRGRTWELGANVGTTVLDAGFDAEFLGYTVASSPQVPPHHLDNLDSVVGTLGVRAAYNFTRSFALELNVESGTTEVGDSSSFTIARNVVLEDTLQTNIFLQHQAAVPSMQAALSTLEFDYVNAGMSALFNFNNRPTSKWVFYLSLGGGAFTLNPDTAAWNDCNPVIVTNDPSRSVFNPTTTDPDFQPIDPFPDNPDRILIQPGCDRAFTTGTAFRGVDVVMGTVFFDSDPLKIKELDPDDPRRDDPNLEVDPVTEQVFIDGVPQWDAPPGRLRDVGFRRFGRVRSIDEFFYSTGVGARWYFKPRHAVRIDARRNWAESINKNMNVVTVGYSFTVGRGRFEATQVPDVLPSEAPGAAGEIPPPGEDPAAGTGEPPADDTPAEDEPPAADEPPAGDEPPAADESPAGDEPPAADEPPAGDGSPVR